MARTMNVTRNTQKKPVSKATVSKATVSKATVSKATVSKATVSKATVSKDTSDTNSKDHYVTLWVGAKDRLRIAENQNKRYEQLLSDINIHIEPTEECSYQVVSGDINTASYWKDKLNQCNDRIKFAENRFKILRDAHNNSRVF
jgi:hypothetical protein